MQKGRFHVREKQQKLLRAVQTRLSVGLCENEKQFRTVMPVTADNCTPKESSTINHQPTTTFL